MELENHDSLKQPAASGQGINGLDLIELSVDENSKITNVSFMKNLKILNARGICGIDQYGINGLEIIDLYVCNNINFFHEKYLLL
jgi:hypothetical protein